jgi:DNA-binding PadR family transcriptional regulator
MPDARSFLPLSTPQFQILLALVDADRHGYGIILDVAGRTGGAIRLGTGTLYTAIARLDALGLVQESPRRPKPADDDERRRYYRLTALGAAVLRAETARLAALVRDAQRKGVGRAPRPAWSRSK